LSCTENYQAFLSWKLSYTHFGCVPCVALEKHMNFKRLQRLTLSLLLSADTPDRYNLRIAKKRFNKMLSADVILINCVIVWCSDDFVGYKDTIHSHDV
jgi:hypothetical protein